MGAHNGKVPVRARREPRASTSARVKTDSPSPRKDAELKLEWDKMDEDVKPQVTPAKLAQQLQVKRESPEDVKPVICVRRVLVVPSGGEILTLQLVRS